VTAARVDAADGLPLTIPALLHARAAARGDSVLLVCDEDVLTYSEADRRSAALARGLLAAGAGKGTQVGILHPNGSAFAVAWLAAARIGAVGVPLSTFSTAAELRVLLRNADVALLLASSSYRSHDYVAALRGAVPELDFGAEPPLFAASLPVLRRIAFADPHEGVGPAWSLRALEESGRSVDPGVLAAAEAGVGPGDRLTIVHTSGSSGDPKGVIHTHGASIRHLDNLNQIRRYTPGEVLFSNSPFFWIGGLAYSLLGTLVAGARLVCSNAPHAAGVLDVLERERPTMVNGFAQSVAHLPHDPSFPKRDLSSIRRGNLYPILPAAVRPARPDLRHAMLGMTEAGSVCLTSDDESDQPEHRRGSFGRPAPGFEARVVDPATGAACGPCERGELWLRGPFLMEGYYGRERHETFDVDGWYRTGDLFTVDDDGFFYFEGRRGDMIKTSGANVSPREVEAAIHEITGLAAHVIGIADAARGQVVAAALRVPAGRAVDLDALRERLAVRLSAYKVPRRFLLLPDEAVPVLSSGKLDRPALEALFDDAR
jgi:acyl-CoA synthetase (AMP-forming)/AMP-acid ligase II